MNFFRKIFFYILYHKNPPWDTGVSPPELLEFIHLHQAGKALELGCGTGTNAITLAQNGWSTTAVDFIPNVIQQAKIKAKKARVNIDFRVDDVTKLATIQSEFDFILDIGCFHSLSANQRSRYRQNIHRLLSKSGTFLLYAFFTSDPSQKARWLSEDDIDRFSPPLILRQRKNSLDPNGREAAWLTFTYP